MVPYKGTGLNPSLHSCDTGENNTCLFCSSVTCSRSSPALYCKATTPLIYCMNVYECIHSQFFMDDFRQKAPENYRVECQNQGTKQHRHLAAMVLRKWHDWALNLALRFLASKKTDTVNYAVPVFRKEPKYRLAWVPKQTSSSHLHIGSISLSKCSTSFLLLSLDKIP